MAKNKLCGLRLYSLEIRTVIEDLIRYSFIISLLHIFKRPRCLAHSRFLIEDFLVSFVYVQPHYIESVLPEITLTENNISHSRN